MICTRYASAGCASGHLGYIVCRGIREAVFNALVHNNYASGIPIQMRFEEDSVFVRNSCTLPRDWTAETLMQKHKYSPFNPTIANAFSRAGFIDAWGCGFPRMLELCRELGCSAPCFTIADGCMTVRLPAARRRHSSVCRTCKPDLPEACSRPAEVMQRQGGICV